MTGLAELVYDPNTERLSGIAGGRAVALTVHSGGHRGALDRRRWQDDAASRNQSRVGGPIPAGTYTIHWLNDYTSPTGKVFGRCCFLWPDPTTKARIDAAGRRWNDFLIHRPGKIGSEGCLIPWPTEDFEALMDLLAGAEDEVRGRLKVLPIGTPGSVGEPSAR